VKTRYGALQHALK